jgi:hypothetical protein
MRVWFDPNARAEDGRYWLNCLGTRRDLAALGVELAVGMRLTLYVEDQNLEGEWELLLVDAVVEDDGGFVARVDPETWRREPAPSGGGPA